MVIEPGDVARIFDHRLDGEARGLVEALTTALRELGTHLLERHDSSAAALVESGSSRRADPAGAGRGAGPLPCWDDRHTHDDIDVSPSTTPVSGAGGGDAELVHDATRHAGGALLCSLAEFGKFLR